jgi:hypothetical protein
MSLLSTIATLCDSFGLEHNAINSDPSSEWLHRVGLCLIEVATTTPGWPRADAHDTPRSTRWLSFYTQSGMASVGGVKAKGADLQNRRRAIGLRPTSYPTGPAHATRALVTCRGAASLSSSFTVL